MKLTTLKRYCGRLSCGGFLLGTLLIALPLPARRVFIYSASSAGSTVDVIDSATNKVVQVIESIELPHDVAFSADGSRVYISDEAENMLDVVDQKTGQIIKKVPLSGSDAECHRADLACLRIAAPSGREFQILQRSPVR